jgi:hypothetical protein
VVYPPALSRRRRQAPSALFRSRSGRFAVTTSSRQGDWFAKVFDAEHRRLAPVSGVEALEARGLDRAQRSSLAEGDAHERAWA